MRIIVTIIVTIISLQIPYSVFGQSTFSTNEYSRFLGNNKDLSSDEFLSRHAPLTTYYSGRETVLSQEM